MPLPKSDYGDFSASDPFLEMLRAAQDYYMPGPYAGTGGTTTASNYMPKASRNLPAVRLDLARAMASRPQPRLPAGWAQQSVQSEEVPIGSPGGMPMPAPGARIPMPEMGESNIPIPAQNALFHDQTPPMPQMSPMARDLGPATASNPAIMNMAKLLAGRNSGAPFQEQGQRWATRFNPEDLRNAPWVS